MLNGSNPVSTNQTFLRLDTEVVIRIRTLESSMVQIFIPSLTSEPSSHDWERDMWLALLVVNPTSLPTSSVLAEHGGSVCSFPSWLSPSSRADSCLAWAPAVPVASDWLRSGDDSILTDADVRKGLEGFWKTFLPNKCLLPHGNGVLTCNKKCVTSRLGVSETHFLDVTAFGSKLPSSGHLLNKYCRNFTFKGFSLEQI